MFLRRTCLCRVVQHISSCTDRFPSLTQLELRSVGLVGDLELPELDGSSPLAVLRLSGNSLSGTLPEGLASLTALSVLSLDSNLFTGTLPAFLGQLQPLRTLELQDNAFEGEIPRGLCAQLCLRSLNAKGNRLSGSLPSELGGCSSFDVRMGTERVSIAGPVPCRVCLRLKRALFCG